MVTKYINNVANLMNGFFKDSQINISKEIQSASKQNGMIHPESSNKERFEIANQKTASDSPFDVTTNRQLWNQLKL